MISIKRCLQLTLIIIYGKEQCFQWGMRKKPEIYRVAFAERQRFAREGKKLNL